MTEFHDGETNIGEPVDRNFEAVAEGMAVDLLNNAKSFFQGERPSFCATFSTEGISGRAYTLFNGLLGLVPDVVRLDVGTEMREWKDEVDGVVKKVFPVRKFKFACNSGRTIIAEMIGQCIGPADAENSEAPADFEHATIVYKSEISETTHQTSEQPKPRVIGLLSLLNFRV